MLRQLTAAIALQRACRVMVLALIVAFFGMPGRCVAQGFALESPAFASGATIPRVYTCEDADKSPPLSWRGVPARAKTIALIVDDPDAPRGTWVHWVLYNLAARTDHLDESVAKTPTLANGARQGVNDFGRIGYNGPCPPAGAAHHYRFRMLAIDTSLDLSLGATASQLEAAARGHTLASAEFIAIFAR
jgi:Raf kinase inhibitor-like YbhB/YbcL family protein